MRVKGRKPMRANLKQSVMAVALLLMLGGATAAVRVASAQQAPPPPPSKFKLMSSAYAEGSMIPTQYSCADPNATSPALSWSNPPSSAMSFAVIMHDTDGAPMKGAMDVTHWIFWNIPASSTTVAG